MKKLFLGVLFLLSIQGYCFSETTTPLTLSELRTRTRVIVKDANSSRQRYTDAQVNDVLNEAQRDSFFRTMATKSSTTVTLVAGTTYYDWISDNQGIYPFRIDFEQIDGTIEELEETTMAELESTVGVGWQNNDGSPESYFFNDVYTNRIGIYPFPASGSTGTITIFYLRDPGRMTDDGDTPWLASNEKANAFYYILPYYAAARLLSIEGQIEKASAYKELYDQGVFLMGEISTGKPNYRPGFSGPANQRN